MRTPVTPLCPVAVKLGQTNFHAPEHYIPCGVVACERCGERFTIGPNTVLSSNDTEAVSVGKLKARLADDHRYYRDHADWYELPD